MMLAAMKEVTSGIMGMNCTASPPNDIDTWMCHTQHRYGL